jgi:hypothetical protein
MLGYFNQESAAPSFTLRGRYILRDDSDIAMNSFRRGAWRLSHWRLPPSHQYSSNGAGQAHLHRDTHP